nr:MAG TPA: hypothetical protein [Caudoviricetes sp.]
MTFHLQLPISLYFFLLNPHAILHVICVWQFYNLLYRLGSYCLWPLACSALHGRTKSFQSSIYQTLRYRF